MQATCSSTRISQGAEVARRKQGQELLLWFLWERMGGTGVRSFGFASLYNFSVPWDILAVHSCLSRGPRVIREEDRSSECKSLIKGVVVGLGSGSVGLHMKGRSPR